MSNYLDILSAGTKEAVDFILNFIGVLIPGIVLWIMLIQANKKRFARKADKTYVDDKIEMIMKMMKDQQESNLREHDAIREDFMRAVTSIDKKMDIMIDKHIPNKKNE